VVPFAAGWIFIKPFCERLAERIKGANLGVKWVVIFAYDKGRYQ